MTSPPPEMNTLEESPPIPNRDKPVSAPRIPFNVFMDKWQWFQGQHLALIGPTGSGKTTLAMAILPKQSYTTVLATKPRDTTMDSLAATGYKVFKRWPQSWPWNSPNKYPKRIIWPQHFQLGKSAKEKQKAAIYEAMAAAFLEGNWCVYTDELYYLVNELGLGSEVKQYLLQGRSLGISFACATQRPAWVPLEVYDQSTHLFFWKDNDETNLKRISGISGERSQSEIRNAIRQLDRHEFLYINTVTGAMVRSKAEKEG